MDKKECGTTSILLQHRLTNEYLGFVASCKQLSCPLCGERVQEYLKELIAYYTQTKGLKYFFTLTTGNQDESELREKFSSIMELLRQTEEETYVANYLSKYPKKTETDARKAYENWVRELFDEEHFYVWLYGKKLTQQEKDEIYTPISNIGVYVTDMLNDAPTKIKERHIKPLLEELTGRRVQKKTLDSYYDSHIESQRKKWKGFKYKDTKNRRSEFLADFEKFMMDVATVRYWRAFPNVEERQVYRSKIPDKGSKLSYIRNLELHQNGAPHYHSLTNYYVPISLIKKVMKYNVYDVQEVEGLKSEDLSEKDGADHRDFNQYVANYLAKYVTKTSLEIYETMKEEGKDGVHIISSSDDISIQLKDAFKAGMEGEYKLIKTAPGVLRMGSQKFNSVSEFDRNLITNFSFGHPNAPIQEIINYLESYMLKARKKMSRSEREGLRQELKLFRAEKEAQALENELKRREYTPIFSFKLNGKLKQGNLSSEQFEAIKGILKGKNQFVFLVGYAGAGKTYTLTQLIKQIDLNKHRVAIATYAAKAKERVKELMRKNEIDTEKVEIQTIHTLCGAKMAPIDYPVFHNDWNKQLPYDVIIIDEYSLVPLEVLIVFLGAISRFAKVIFVGDQGQLNPVGSKNPLFYLGQKTRIDKYELTKNFRSGEDIAEVANQVRRGNLGKLEFLPFDWDVIDQFSEKNYQILANSVALKDSINLFFQKDKRDIKLRYHYDVWDAVMITKNDRYKKYSNGEFATIIDYNADMQIATLKTEAGVEFTMTEAQMNTSIEPRHCITIHKSQGSEFDKVLIVLDLDKTNLTNRNMLYTAITRAKTDFAIMIKQKTLTDEHKERLMKEQEL